MIVTYLVLALPMSLLWMLVTGYFEPASFVIGYAIGLGVLTILRPQVTLNLAKLPGQLIAMIGYTGRLTVDTIRSTLDVTRRVLSPSMPLDPGVVTVEVHDGDATHAALSAHAITITPGELVIDFMGEEDDTMQVHTLDREETAAIADDEQVRRLKQIRRMTGHG